MTVEYVVLGVVLIVMGGVQGWLRHGPGARALRQEQERLQKRRLEAEGSDYPSLARSRLQTNKAWSAWTAVLGLVSIGLGIVLLVMGVMGR